MTKIVPGREAPAERFERIAERLEAKAEWARQRANAHAAGDAGERRLGDAVAPLGEEGWLALHDRLRPHGGNIDHILIGPSGVYVLDSKAWTGPITVEANVLKSNGRSQSRDVVAIAGQAVEVRAVLRSSGHLADVKPGLVFTGTDPGPAAPVSVDGVVLCGVDDLVASLRRRPAVLTPEQMIAVTRNIAEAFPPARITPAETTETVLPHDDGVISDPPAAVLKGSRWLYLQPWSKAGRRRIYLHDTTGEQLGWKNLRDGTIAVTSERNPRVIRAVLLAATPGGLDLAKEQVPKLPLKIPGGGFVSAVTRTYTTIHVGQRWLKGDQDRLYCTAANPVYGVHKLGYVDLVTGALHPTDAALPRELGPASTRLAWMLQRRPVSR